MVICWKLCRNHCNTLKLAVSRDFCTSLSKCSKVRVRFAPSPTGMLHIGGLRTALYNFLFAKSHNGSFILRIEDTDQTRLVPGATQKLEETLSWLDLQPDESPSVGGMYGPYIQSERLNIYNENIKTLLQNGSAYYCFCTAQRLNLIRREASKRGQIPRYDNRCRHLTKNIVEKKIKENVPYVIRFKLEPFTEPFNDLIYGPISYNVADNEGDPVVIKSDGYPTYHFANVVDDHLMEVTHVLRGVEWQVSTPKHILLYEAFKWIPPKFGHLPLIMNKNGSKLSKRDGSVFVEEYKSKGYFPEVILNFAFTIGESSEKSVNSIFNLREMTNKFDLDQVKSNSCRMDPSWLDKFSSINIKRKLEDGKHSVEIVNRLKNMVEKHFESKTLHNSATEDEFILRVLNTTKDEIYVLEDLMKPEWEFLWLNSIKINNKDLIANDNLKNLYEILKDLPNEQYTKDNINKHLHEFVQSEGINISDVMQPLRKIISGQKKGPKVADMVQIIGRNEFLKRLRLFLDAEKR